MRVKAKTLVPPPPQPRAATASHTKQSHKPKRKQDGKVQKDTITALVSDKEEAKARRRVAKYTGRQPVLPVNQSPQDMLKQLLKHSYCVLKVYDEKQTVQVRDAILQSIRKFRCWKEELPVDFQRSPSHVLGMGKMQASAAPGAYHDPVIREHRRAEYEVMHPLLEELNRYLSQQHSETPFFVTQTADRIALRRKCAFNMPSGSTSVHRDVTSVNGQPTLAIGGWFNGSAATQYIWLLPGSHGTVTVVDDGGFKAVDKKLREDFMARAIYVQVPPGCRICFISHTAHGVCPDYDTDDSGSSLRVFTGYVFSTSPRHPVPGFLQRVADQAPLPMTSGKPSVMYDPQHRFHKDSFSAFAKQFAPHCFKATGSFSLLQEFGGLKTAFPNDPSQWYPEYTAEELSRMCPHRL